MSPSSVIVCFLARMAAVVIGPLAGESKWGNDAKVRRGRNESFKGWGGKSEMLIFLIFIYIFFGGRRSSSTFAAAVFGALGFVATSLSVHYLVKLSP